MFRMILCIVAWMKKILGFPGFEIPVDGIQFLDDPAQILAALAYLPVKVIGQPAGPGRSFSAQEPGNPPWP